jgi:hypothetical protein
MEDKSLYEHLGGVYSIAAVVNRFSDEVVKNPMAGQASQNSALKIWHTKKLDRLPGLKFMRTLGSAQQQAARYNAQAQSLDKANWAWRKPIGTYASHLKNSMRLRQNLRVP